MSSGAVPSPPRSRGKGLAIVGTILSMVPLLGFLVSVAMVMMAFSTLDVSATSGGGTGDPTVLAGSVSAALIPLAIGTSIGLIGLVLVSIALFGMRFREPWFFICGMVAAVVWLMVAFPMSSLVSAYLLTIFLIKRPEFYQRG